MATVEAVRKEVTYVLTLKGDEAEKLNEYLNIGTEPAANFRLSNPEIYDISHALEDAMES